MSNAVSVVRPAFFFVEDGQHRGVPKDLFSRMVSPAMCYPLLAMTRNHLVVNLASVSSADSFRKVESQLSQSW